jgi:hypothetical protein
VEHEGQMYCLELIKYLDGGDLPADDSMSIYLLNPSKKEYGKKAYGEEF